MFILFLFTLAILDTPVLVARTITAIIRESISIKKPDVQDKESLNSAEDRGFKEQFQALEPRAKQCYLMNLSIEEYQSFLGRFSSDNEWKRYWQEMPKNKHLNMCTWSDQRNMVGELYYFIWSLSSGDMFTQTFRHFRDHIRSDSKKNLNYWRKECLEKTKTDPDRDKLINEIFALLKLQMLNIYHK